MGVGGGEFLAEKCEGLEIWVEKFEVPFWWKNLSGLRIGRRRGSPPTGARARGIGVSRVCPVSGQPSHTKGFGGPAYLHE